MGRKRQLQHDIQVKVTEDMYQALWAEARKRGVRLGDVMRQALGEFIAKNKQPSGV